MAASIGNRVKIGHAALLFLLTTQALSFDLKGGHVLLQAGAFKSSQGQSQNIYIKNLLGDRFDLTKRNDSNGLFGIGYMIPGASDDLFDLAYGVNAFYFPKTSVKGTITQEFLYTNLAYHYGISHAPIYATVKATVTPHSDRYALTFDAGVGPNFHMTTTYHDWSIDGGVTFPDQAFLSNTQAKLSGMAGVGVKFNHVIGSAPVEIGYRFFYLGEGRLERRTNQLLNTLKTGDVYANALIATLTI
jgi:hypothetical protein